MSRRLVILGVLLWVVVLVPAAAVAAEPTARVIVAREAGLDAGERSALRAQVDGSLVKTLRLPDTEVIEVPADRVGVALEELRSDPGVRYAERDGRVRAFAPIDQFEQPGLERIAAPGAWPLSTGGGATVAVVDTGVRLDLPELRGRIDGRGADFVQPGTSATDPNGHGTEVAGVVAAGRDGVGMVGVAYDASILPLRSLDSEGGGFTSDVAAAFDYAGRLGVRVVNASLGGPTTSATLEASIRAHPNTLYVVAAGNEANNNTVQPTYPCDTAAVNIVCVGATDSGDAPAFFTNFGRRSVDLAAPGVGIPTTGLDRYVAVSGTSFSAPFVAGAAALLFARNPSVSALAVKNALLAGVDPVAALSGQTVSGGRLNASRTLTVAPLDADADGIGDVWDLCPSAADPNQGDRDADGVGDGCDDADADGVVDLRDRCPDLPARRSVDGCQETVDTDGDGRFDVVDRCATLAGTGPDGCPVPPAPPPDSDGDGRPDATDRCAAVAARTRSGCPAPMVRSIRSRVISGRRAILVELRLDRPASVSVAAQLRRCRSGGCRYERVAIRRTAAGRRTVSVRLVRPGARRFARGRYRLQVAATVSPETRRRTRTLRVR